MPNCIYNGITYTHGAIVCQNGNEMRCDSYDGSWRPTGNTCNEDGKLIRDGSQEPDDSAAASEMKQN